jgi:16S rRNA G966 N2-methylase RsmD
MSIRVRERTLYEYIGRVFSKYGCKYVTQVGVGAREPDLIIEYDGSRVISEVKIDSEIKREDAIVDAYAKALSLKTPHAMALLFPRYVRDIPVTELEKVFPNLEVSALVLTEWLSDRMDSTTLDNLARQVASHYQEWLKTKIPRVNYDLVVDIARNGISEIASHLRSHLFHEPILNSAMAVIGRFDIYKTLLEEVSGIQENEAKLYIADIAAYVLTNQLLFYQILSEKMGYERFPDFSPISPPKDLLDVIDKLFNNARSEYSKILGLDLFPLLRETKDLRILYSVARLVSALKMLRPQHIQEDLFGRLYHETIPPETKKNLGAFYTKPEAAKLLATLAIDKWDSKVLDPACGSGTLLVESYQRKAKLAPSIDKDELHRKFAKEDIYGIDVMHFAAHMTATNLTSQNIRHKLEPNVFSRDGIDAMANPINADPDPPTVEQTLDKWIETMSGVGIPRDFDIVIMNPPFTRRERIPDEISKLHELVPEVKGKTGYWAYFVISADNVLKKEAVLAVVMPEEFFVGGAAKSIREYLLEKGYSVNHIVRSAVEVAFSEAAHYRDYLIVFSRGFQARPLVVTILKKKLKDLTGQIGDVSIKIKEFSSSNDQRLSLEEFESLRISDAGNLLTRHIVNLKPLVGFNTVKAHTLSLELLDRLKDTPTIGELDSSGLIRMRLYRPGQYKTKGVEKFAEKLFTSRYGARSPNVTFLFNRIRNDVVQLKLKRAKISFTIPVDSLILSLRTYSAVKHLDISNEEEFGIVDPDPIEEHLLRLSGLIPREKVKQASEDIQEAYNDFAGNILLARRIRLTSPNAYWLTFYSDNNVLGSQLPTVQARNAFHAKMLALYLNSTLCLLQLISFAAETEGAWVSLDHKRVWSLIHVPDIKNLKPAIVDKALDLLSRVGKVEVNSLFERIKNHDKIQKSIDEMALEMIGLEDWKNRLDELYDAVAAELTAMHRILETSKKGRRKKQS